jgi:hypothetical protein
MLNKIIKKILNEITSTSSSRGSYVSPLLPGLRDFGDKLNKPYTEILNDYDSALLDYDSLDGDMSTHPKWISKIEKRAEKVTNDIKKHPDKFAWDGDAGIMNSLPKKNTDAKPIKLPKKQKPKTKLESIDDVIKNILRETIKLKSNENAINEVDSSTSAGVYSGPVELGLKKWKKNFLSPFSIEVDHDYNDYAKKPSLKNNIKRTVGVWEKNKDGSYNQEEYPVHAVNEDLAVWFGKKKKTKGSSQPKGPWVDICRKVDGKHPPCGRKDADTGSYPKCRASGVAGKMSDSQKRSACQQKRNAEKKDPQSGKGQKPVMTSYKTKKMNEDQIIRRILRNL